MRFLKQNAVGLLALAVALSGTAYAANTITARDIKPNAIRSPHIKNGQVKRSDLANDLRRRIAHDEVGLSSIKVKVSPMVILAAGATGTARVDCPPRSAVIGGGYLGLANAVVGSNGISRNGWEVVATNQGNSPISDFRAQAVCISL